MNTKDLANAIIDMAEKDKGLVLSKLEELIEAFKDAVETSPRSGREILANMDAEMPYAGIQPIRDASGRTHVFVKGQNTISDEALDLIKADEYSRGFLDGSRKGRDVSASDRVHAIAKAVLAKYNITSVWTEIFDHGGMIGIAAEHNGKRDSVKVHDCERTAQEGFKISDEAIENAAFNLAQQLTRK